MKTFKEAEEVLKGRKTRKLENNTYLEVRDENTIAVRLHGTDVITYHKAGLCTLNTGGWQTNTTKDRINKYSPIGISQKKNVWYVSCYEGNGVHVPLGEFKNGMGFTDAGELYRG